MCFFCCCFLTIYNFRKLTVLKHVYWEDLLIKPRLQYMFKRTYTSPHKASITTQNDPLKYSLHPQNVKERTAILLNYSAIKYCQFLTFLVLCNPNC